ncbi:hypothetical protein [Photobacterium leiognathi]|uniref:hypothetical protein n=1 Tax=Photobacterium leiognathi TaxID=553611 RepID=UPI002981F539|nr:hypothetical protein [Photobacterium leiognathi]
MNHLISGNSILALIAFLSTLYFYMHRYISTRDTFKIKTLEFLTELFNDKDNLAHKFSVEESFYRNIKIILDYKTITLFLSLDNPTKALQLYKKSSDYLEIKDGKLVYKRIYKNKFIRFLFRIFKPIFNVLFYFIFASISFILVVIPIEKIVFNDIFPAELAMADSVFWSLCYLFSLLLAGGSLLFLFDSRNIKYAHELLPMFNENKPKQKQFYY